jgi:nicotinate phosphoribosyltransferase
VQTGETKRYTAKFSADKSTVPGAKQVFRYADHDLVACSWECPPWRDDKHPVALLRPVIIGGELVEPLPDTHAAREHCAASLEELPRAIRTLFDAKQPYPVHHSAELKKLIRRARAAAGASAE